MTLRNKPIPEEHQTTALLWHAATDPGVLDLPPTDPWVQDYYRTFDRQHPGRDARWVWGYLPHNAPRGWAVLLRGCDGLIIEHTASKHYAMLTGRVFGYPETTRRFLRMSFATFGGDDYPSYLALATAKQILMPGLEGYLIFPPTERLPANVARHALHLFFPLDGGLLPDLRDEISGGW